MPRQFLRSNFSLKTFCSHCAWFVIFLLPPLVGYAQQSDFLTPAYIPFTKAGEHGCLSHTGEVVVPPNFEYSSCLGSRFVPVQREARFTLFDSQKGRTVDKILYDYIEALDNNLFLAQNLSEVALFRGKRKFFEGKKTNFQLCPSKKYYAVKDGKSMRIFNMQNVKIGDFVADAFKIDGHFLQLMSKNPINPLTQNNKDTITISSIQNLETNEKISDLLINSFHTISDSLVAVATGYNWSYQLLNINSKEQVFSPWTKENSPAETSWTSYDPISYRYFPDLEIWLIRTDKHVYLSTDSSDIVLLSEPDKYFNGIADAFTEDNTIYLPFQGSLISISPNGIDTTYVSDVSSELIKYYGKVGGYLIYYGNLTYSGSCKECDFFRVDYKKRNIEQLDSLNTSEIPYSKKPTFLTYATSNSTKIYSLKTFKTVGKSEWVQQHLKSSYIHYKTMCTTWLDSTSLVAAPQSNQPYELIVHTEETNKDNQNDLNYYSASLTYGLNDTVNYYNIYGGPLYQIEVFVDGTWKRITENQVVGCAFHFSEQMSKGTRWHFRVKKFKGVVSTKCRISMELPINRNSGVPDTITIYSNEFLGNYNPGQLWRDQYRSYR